ILGPDCGTTGGYPVAGRVIMADLHRLASLGSGQIVHLESVDLDFAIKAKANLDRELSQAVIRPSSLGLW
ncbi:MAG: allophanate hydrolase subunit 2 family protein, partial [Acidobacteria bacterium]|nr:allophanate hydrolase subunit 2 family protein [Acidobacteriota bacterium]